MGSSVMRLVGVAVLLGSWSCKPGRPDPDQDLPEPTPPTATWPHPIPLLRGDEPVQGVRGVFMVEAVPPGATVTLMVSSAGMGEGPCEAGIVGCSGILDATPVGDPMVAGPDGVARVVVAIPADAPARTVWFQAQVQGAASGTIPEGVWSNVLERSVTLAPAGAPVAMAERTAGLGFGRVFTFGNTHTGGLAWIDYNGDHWPDLFVTNGGGFNHALFRNNGGASFTDVTPAVRKRSADQEEAGVCFADIDNDGDSDLFVPVDNPTPYSATAVQPFEGGPNLLYVNQGDGTFREEAQARGVVDPRGWRNITCTFADFDADGWVDLYLGTWAINNPPETPRYGRLLLNDGTGAFVDSGAELGRGRDVLTSTAFDMDLDGGTDLYLGNVNPVDGYVGTNPPSDDVLYRDVAGVLTDATADSPGVGDDAWAAMGVDVGDVDNDGDFDLYVTDRWDILDPLPRGNPLYLNQGDGTFADNSCDAAEICTGHLSWPASFADFDGDGWVDLWVGTSRRNALDLMYVNDRDGTFTSVFVPHFVNRSTHGGTVADFDGDGSIDLAAWMQSSDLRVFQNVDATPHHWLELELVGRTANRGAIGATVRVVAAEGPQLRRVSGGDSAHSQASSILHFGLGQQPGPVDVEIVWPGGAVQRVEDVLVDRFVLIEQGSGVVPEALPMAVATWSAAEGLSVRARSNYGGRTELATPAGPLTWDPDNLQFSGVFPSVEAPTELEIVGRFGGPWVVPVVVE